MPDGSDLCDEADAGRRAPDAAGAPAPGDVADMCAESRKFQTLQWVFYGLSAVSIGAGTYLLATEPSTEAGPPEPQGARLQVLPVVGPGVGSLDVRLIF